MGISSDVCSRVNWSTVTFRRRLNVEASPDYAAVVQSDHRRLTSYQATDSTTMRAFREFLILKRPSLAVLVISEPGQVNVHTLRRRALTRADVLGAFSLSLFMGPKFVADFKDSQRITVSVARRWIDELSERYPHFDNQRQVAFFGLTDHGFFREGDVEVMLEAMHAFACGKDST